MLKGFVTRKVESVAWNVLRRLSILESGHTVLDFILKV